MRNISTLEAARRREQLNNSLNERLNVAGAAGYVGVSQSYMNKLRGTGGGPVFIKVGKRVVYAVSDLDRWLATLRRESTSDEGGSVA